MTTTDDFVDTMAVPRRQTMPYEPESWRAAHAASEIHDDEDSEFGAMEGVVQARNYIAAAWLVIAVVGAVVWWLA